MKVLPVLASCLAMAMAFAHHARADGGAVSARAAARDSQGVPVAPLALSPCGLVLQRSTQFNARQLGPRRAEVSWRAGREWVKLELRFECGAASFDQAAADAAFQQLPGGGWEMRVGTASTPARAVSTPTWAGVVGNRYQGSVCRSVVGKATSSDSTFFAEFCLPEATYRKTSAAFDAVERQLVFQSGR